MNRLGITRDQLKKFLEEHSNQKVEILKTSKLGTGFMAAGYRIDFKTNGENKKVVIRIISPVDFSNDYAADRMASFWIQHHSSKLLPSHIKSLGIIGVNKRTKGIGVVDHYDEFIQVLEWAEGEEYFVDLEKIIKEDRASDDDFKKVILLSDYLVKIHKKKFRGAKDQALSLYKRHTRDYVGSRFMIDVLDTYPTEISFTSWDKLHKLVFEVYKYREKSKNNFLRLSKIHGDFHPGNVRFKDKNKFIILDASRAIWGEPADDVSCLGINYLWYSLRQTGKFKGIFKELFDTFWNNYIKKTGDQEINTILPLFIAIRSVVLKHPLYFSVNDKIRKKLLAFAYHSLKKGDFEKSLND